MFHTASQLPPRSGIGLKPMHFRQFVETWPDLGFVEIHAENYMVDGGPFHHYLTRIRERYPLSVHGVGLSIGGELPPDRDHLDRLAVLLGRYAPESFSEHLAWSSHGGVYFNDLLPLPYSARSLDRVCAHIDQVQERLQCRMLLENPATYVEFEASTMEEAEFVGEILRRTGCGLLLDISNAYVSSVNHHRDPHAVVSALARLGAQEIHLAGYALDRDGGGFPLLIDNHGAPVAEAVWALYRHVLDLCGPTATLIERDNDVPPLEVLCAEAWRADRLMHGTSISPRAA